MEHGRADGLTVILDDPTDRDPWPRCEFAGIYCGALTVEQLQAAGRARICCRHLLFTDEVA